MKIIRVRIATPDDRALLELWSKDFFRRAPLLPSPQPDMLKMGLRLMINDGLVLIAEDGDGYAGSMGLKTGGFWWTRELHIAEQWIHARPGSARSARALIDGARAIAARQGRALYLGDLSGADALKKAALYERAGGALLGAMFRF